MTKQTKATAADLTRELALRVGDDGTGDLRVIVDAALEENPEITLDELVEIVLDARADAALES